MGFSLFVLENNSTTNPKASAYAKSHPSAYAKAHPSSTTDAPTPSTAGIISYSQQWFAVRSMRGTHTCISLVVYN